ncbi:hypothetical protein V6N13_099261 [Hibiscus sabdariffa]
MLPYHVLLKIVAIKAPTKQVGSDIVGWHGDVMRRFTVKSAYGVRSASQSFQDNSVWKVVHRHGVFSGSVIEQSRHYLDLGLRALVANLILR